MTTTLGEILIQSVKLLELIFLGADYMESFPQVNYLQIPHNCSQHITKKLCIEVKFFFLLEHCNETEPF